MVNINKRLVVGFTTLILLSSIIGVIGILQIFDMNNSLTEVSHKYLVAKDVIETNKREPLA